MVGATAATAGQAVKDMGAASVLGGLEARRMAGEAQKASQALDAYGLSATRTAKQLEAEASAAAGAAGAQAEAVRRFTDSLNPLGAAQRRAAEDTATLQGWLARGEITHTQYVAGVNRITGELEKMGRSAHGAGAGSVRFGAMLQQAGYQLSDVAAVAAMGGNVLATAGVQAGQFLGYFGPWAAVLGAAATVGGIFATQLIATGGAADKATDAEEAYRSTLEKANELTKTAIELQRQKELATLAGAKATVAAQSAVASGDFSRTSQELTALRAKDAKKGVPGYASRETLEAEARQEEAFQRLRNLDQARVGVFDDKGLARKAGQDVVREIMPQVSALEKLKQQQDTLLRAASVTTDPKSLQELTEAYGGVSHAIATYRTRGEGTCASKSASRHLAHDGGKPRH